MIRPLVSVAMICYNHENFIAEAIDSILEQNFIDFELVIVDDGSTDNTAKIINTYSDKRINHITINNSGPSVALNTALKKCTGDYLALMSGDDVSMPNRFDTQLRQIEINKADLVFCLPELIGPRSEFLSRSKCRYFFDKEDFSNTPELYRMLFAYGNFLCAPSAFMRRSIIDKAGYFHKGLMQLQDFEYWIRVCKKNYKVMLFKDPLLQYRYLFGVNLSSVKNNNRSKIETFAVYRSFFKDCPVKLFINSFNEDIDTNTIGNVEYLGAQLMLSHKNPIVQVAGAEAIIELMDNNNNEPNYGLVDPKDSKTFFQSLNALNSEDILPTPKALRLYHFYNQLVRPSLKVISNKEKVKNTINNCIDQGDYKKALNLAGGLDFQHKELSLTGITPKIYNKVKKYVLLINEKLVTNYRLSVFHLDSVYNYCKNNKSIVFEFTPEKVFIQKPLLLGQTCNDSLFEGESSCPRQYVAAIEDAIVYDTSLIFNSEGNFLNDEMCDYTSQDYGIKSRFVKYRYKDKVMISYKSRPLRKVDEGILISCDHSYNYFHWLTESLPKIPYIDQFDQYSGLPLLIPAGLHDNLERALEILNTQKRTIFRLKKGEPYKIKRLIYPSNLSRVLDRYVGKPIYHEDIVLSNKWISAAMNTMRQEYGENAKPWRKIFLTRRKGLRSLENIKEVEQLLISNHFEIVELDWLTLESQISLFSQASVVVVPTGAALTNMLFCQSGTKVIAFMSNHESTNYYMWSQLAGIAEVDLRVILGERLYNVTNIYSVHDDYRIDIKLLLNEIEGL